MEEVTYSMKRPNTTVWPTVYRIGSRFHLIYDGDFTVVIPANLPRRQRA